MILAIRGLAAVKEEKAVPRLRELAPARDRPPAARLEAARALAVIRPAGSEADAQTLAADPSPRGVPDRLVAASLLRHHRGDAAVRRLQALARTPSRPSPPSPSRGWSSSTRGWWSPCSTRSSPAGADVRGFGVELLGRRPTADHVKLLGDRLNDVHPAVRPGPEGLRSWPQTRRGSRPRSARGRGSWRERLAGAGAGGHPPAELDHKPAATRLVEAAAPPAQVRVATGWALRVLAVPDTLGPALVFFTRTYRAMQKAAARGGLNVSADGVDGQLSHLAQFFGRARYRPADSLLRELIPPGLGQPDHPAGFECGRPPSGGLGLIHEGKPDAELVRLFVGRLNAVRPYDIEDECVRRMSAVGLGADEGPGHAGDARRVLRRRDAEPGSRQSAPAGGRSNG